MPRFKIEGADRQTGKDVTFEIEAASETAAIHEAGKRAFVASITPAQRIVTPPPIPWSVPDDSAAVAERMRALRWAGVAVALVVTVIAVSIAIVVMRSKRPSAAATTPRPTAVSRVVVDPIVSFRSEDNIDSPARFTVDQRYVTTRRPTAIQLDGFVRKAVLHGRQRRSSHGLTPSSVRIAVYPSADRAEAEGVTWVALGFWHPDRGLDVQVDGGRLAAAYAPDDLRFGMPREDRMRIWRDIVFAERHAKAAAELRIPISGGRQITAAAMEAHNAYRREHYEASLAAIKRMHHLPQSTLDSICLEALEAGWPVP